MDQDQAKILFENGATILFLHVPECTDFGIDLKSWSTGENFRGLKMIPPGLHYVHYSAVNSSLGDVAPRVGFIHNFKKSEILMLTWDKENEEAKRTPLSPEQDERIRADLKNLDRYLGLYPYDVLDNWKNLSNFLTVKLVEKLTPESGIIRSTLEYIHSEDRNKDPDSASKRKINKPGIEDTDDSLLPDLKPRPGTGLRLTPIPDKSYPDNSTPAEITKYSLDASYVLEVLINAHDSPSDLIGEFQFCFICFLIGHSFDAFEHWKRLVHIICSCESALTKHRVVFDLFITACEEQLKDVQEDFLADIVSNSNFVYRKLRELFRAIVNSDVDGRMKIKADVFKENLSKKFQWDFSDLNEEEEDEAPVVVIID